MHFFLFTTQSSFSLSLSLLCPFHFFFCLFLLLLPSFISHIILIFHQLTLPSHSPPLSTHFLFLMNSSSSNISLPPSLSNELYYVPQSGLKLILLSLQILIRLEHGITHRSLRFSSNLHYNLLCICILAVTMTKYIMDPPSRWFIIYLCIFQEAVKGNWNTRLCAWSWCSGKAA